MIARAVVAGRIENLTVREWIAENESEIRELPFVLISSIDSDRRVSDMDWVRACCAGNAGWAISRAPLVISGHSLVRLLDDRNLFTGFDELWVPAALPVEGPPADIALVAPLELDVDEATDILAWLGSSGCRLGVGDGYGLNFAVSDMALGRRLGLGGTSMEQRR